VILRQGILIVVVITCFSLTPLHNPAQAGLLSGPDRNFNLAMFTLGTIGFTTLAYYVYKNSPAERAKGYEENLGLGEWYVGAYSGLSYLPSADWQMNKFSPPFQGRTAKNVTYREAILGGVKFGRYFDRFPWFGIEMETSFSRHAIPGNQGRISPPVPGGPTNALGGSDRFYIWAMQSNLLARYGFLKDKEVPFGRLQPYVGLGPGVEILYGTNDSAKNFAIEALAGVRYMFTQNLGIFSEYKFSYQFDVEYEQVLIGKSQQAGTMTFDVPHHRFTLGVSYHFKNLYGN
jgi:opacity protein-like surface antigen